MSVGLTGVDKITCFISFCFVSVADMVTLSLSPALIPPLTLPSPWSLPLFVLENWSGVVSLYLQANSL